MEFGYKASKEIFDEDDFGKWKFCNDDDIRAIVGEGNPKMKIAVMADVGRTDFEEDIIPKSESPIDLVRIATYAGLRNDYQYHGDLQGAHRGSQNRA